jgi:hypothetical protein
MGLYEAGATYALYVEPSYYWQHKRNIEKDLEKDF